MELTEKTIAENTVFKGRILEVSKDEVLLPNGKTSTRELVKHVGAVCVAALTDKNELLFVRQFRYPFKKTLLELPAGKLESFGTPLDNAVRELKEETGAAGEAWTSLGEMYPSPGYCSEIIHLYFCRVNSISEQSLDDDEFVNVERISLDSAVKMICGNEIKDAKTIVTIFRLKEYLQK